MKMYIVGGYVRDHLMGVSPKDKDFVVVGSNEAEMISLGFERVGADFPVFLKNGDEYALARTEKKTGIGYNGFETYHAEDVTIESDISRRDLTINSIAIEVFDDMKTRLVSYIDPFNGIQDIEDKILRHTSDAFAEDPVRVLRIARFKARFGPDWKVADETKDLIHKMAKSGVLNELTAERVWKELSRALLEPYPHLFFETLLEADALHVLFPEVYTLVSALESHKWHPEGNAFAHTMLVLQAASKLDIEEHLKLAVMFASLVHDFGKGLTKKEHFPKHYGHDVNGVPVVESFADRLKVETKIKEWAMKATRYHMNMHLLDDMKAKTFVKMFDAMQAKNDPVSVQVLLHVGEADARGRLGSHNEDVSNKKKLLTAFNAYNNTKFYDVFPNGETNVEKIKQKLFEARVDNVERVL